jgi:cellulose synthase/poly-beta-1,6-N-acetylglucosamine synthase-like glycosyltransferase
MDHDRRRATPNVPALATSRSSFWYAHDRLVRVITSVALCAGAVYLVWRIGWSGHGTPLALFLPLLAAELFGWCSLASYAFFAWRAPKTAVRPAPDRSASVDVFVCTYDEPVSVLEPTLLACAAITAPHTTYVLDDGQRPEIRELAMHFGARYITRPDNAHAKAGNINHALPLTDGELILFLDADHVPLPDILDATTGYFTDPDVALVQTPHDFLNRDSAQHSAPARHEQTLFYEVIAPGKDRHNSMFWCGSATLVRRTALDAVGGVLTETVAEDFHTTIAMHSRGWRTIYHNETLVQGLAPHNLDGFLLQRARWARGNLAVLRTRENPVTCPGLTLAQRGSYSASLANYFAGLQRATLLVVLIWTLTTGQLPMHASLAVLAALWVPWTALSIVASGALGRGSLGPLDSTRYGLLTMGIHLRAILTLATTRAGAFKVTPKNGLEQGGWRALRSLGMVTTLGAVLCTAWALRVASALGLVALPELPSFALVIVLVLGTWEIGCIVFVLGGVALRRQVRAHYRFPVALRARIARTPSVVSVRDLSSEGLSFLSHLALDDGHRLTLLTRLPDTTGALHDVELPVEVVSCRPFDASHYRIGCRLDHVSDQTRELLVGYCYVVQPAEQFGSIWQPIVPDEIVEAPLETASPA